MSTATMDRETGTKPTTINKCSWCGMPSRHMTCTDKHRDLYSEFLRRTLSESKALATALVAVGLVDKDNYRKAADVLASGLNQSFHWNDVHRKAAR